MRLRLTTVKSAASPANQTVCCSVERERALISVSLKR